MFDVWVEAGASGSVDDDPTTSDARPPTVYQNTIRFTPMSRCSLLTSMRRRIRYAHLLRVSRYSLPFFWLYIDLKISRVFCGFIYASTTPRLSSVIRSGQTRIHRRPILPSAPALNHSIWPTSRYFGAPNGADFSYAVMRTCRCRQLSRRHRRRNSTPSMRRPDITTIRYGSCTFASINNTPNELIYPRPHSTTRPTATYC